MAEIKLIPLEEKDYRQFFMEQEYAFSIALNEEFGPEPMPEEPDPHGMELMRDPKTEAYWIHADGVCSGGVVLSINKETNINVVELLFIHPDRHSKGIGYAAWEAIAASHPETKVWQLMTPYFEKRNIHFYVNKCGFKIVEFFNPRHRGTPPGKPPKPEGKPPRPEGKPNGRGPDCAFLFEKRMDENN